MMLEDYMQQTEFATKQLFDNLEHYHNLLKDIKPPILITDNISDETFIDTWKQWYDTLKTVWYDYD